MVASNELDLEFRALVDFARSSEVPTGFGSMDEDGRVDLERPVELWISARMTHVFALAQMYGIPGTEELVAHGVNSLKKYFHDPVYGGWYSSIMATAAEDGNGVPVNDRKEAYAQAFVILAAASTLAAGNRDAGPLLEDALAQQEEHWLDPETGLVAESWDRSFTECEDYRGINANMHTVEALVAAGDVLGDPMLVERATRILKFAYDRAGENSWRIPEHYTADWQVDPDYNVDEPAHPFRPYGVTPGHGLEFSRLMLATRGSRALRDLPEEEWLLEGAEELARTAVADGWEVDGEPGFVYTTTFEGVPVVRARMHWVVCEAIGQATVAAAVAEELGEHASAQAARQRVDEWWNYAKPSFIEAPGRWTHELDPSNQKAGGTWAGKPDVYHAAQMVLLPRLPVAPAFAAALRDGMIN